MTLSSSSPTASLSSARSACAQALRDYNDAVYRDHAGVLVSPDQWHRLAARLFEGAKHMEGDYILFVRARAIDASQREKAAIREDARLAAAVQREDEPTVPMRRLPAWAVR